MIDFYMSSLFLKNANVINVLTGNTSLQNIRIENGIIQEIGKNAIKNNSAESIDLNGDFVPSTANIRWYTTMQTCSTTNSQCKQG